MQHNVNINLTINSFQFINLHTTKHTLNTVVTKDTFLISFLYYIVNLCSSNRLV